MPFAKKFSEASSRFHANVRIDESDLFVVQVSAEKQKLEA